MQDPSPREAVPGLAITFQKFKKKKKKVESALVKCPCLEYFMENPETKTD